MALVYHSRTVYKVQFMFFIDLKEGYQRLISKREIGNNFVVLFWIIMSIDIYEFYSHSHFEKCKIYQQKNGISFDFRQIFSYCAYVGEIREN